MTHSAPSRLHDLTIRQVSSPSIWYVRVRNVNNFSHINFVSIELWSGPTH